MDQFTPQDAYDWIGLALAVCGILIIAHRLIVLYWKTSRPAYDPLRDGPEDGPSDRADLNDSMQKVWQNCVNANELKREYNAACAIQRSNARYAGATETEGGHHD